MNMPEHYTSVMPYFIVSNAEDFIAFISAVFDAEKKLIVSNDDGTIVHGEYSINGGTIMFGQAGGEWKTHPNGVFVVTDDVDGTHSRALSNGASEIQEPGDRGYGRASGFLDKWDNQWWLNTPEE